MGEFYVKTERVFKLTSVRLAYFIVFVLFFMLTEMGREIYRPYIYTQHIQDFGFADVIGNLLGTVTIIFFNLSVVNAPRTQGVRIIIFVTLGVMVYELLQAVLPRGVMDWKDVAATPIAGLFSLLIFFMIWQRYGEMETAEVQS